MKMTSWKTSAGGIAMILTAVTQIINGYRDTGNISITAEAIGLISGGLALLFARDNNVSSEAAGAIKVDRPAVMASDTYDPKKQ